MAKKKKYYVVWQGHNPGIYESWNECKNQIQGYQGAQYKSFGSRELAEKAFGSRYEEYKGKDFRKTKDLTSEELLQIGKPIADSISVDAACDNKGKMEYRGVYTKNSREIFREGPFEEGTNNVGEFLALVHALALLKKKKSDLPVYSDSRTAISWVKKKNCRTKLVKTPVNKHLFQLIARAEDWLKKNTWKNKILKWETHVWGEIPADFGRK